MAPQLQAGSPGFYRACIALFISGFATFALLYAPQPLLPTFSQEFGISPTESSLIMSVTSGALALFLVPVGSLSETLGRRGLMAGAMLASAALMVLAALSSSFEAMLGWRLLQGIAIAGLPSIAMAWMGEEVEPRSLGAAIGILIAGNSLGGMVGRIGGGFVTDALGWRAALLTFGLLSLLGALAFYWLLPPSRHFVQRQLAFRPLCASLMGHLREPGLLCLFALALMIQIAFTGLLNFASFHLMSPPYNFSQSMLGVIYLGFILGALSSTWAGRLADRHGRRVIQGLGVLLMGGGALLTLLPGVIWQISGIFLLTAAFFGSHSIASSWVGRRALSHKAQASSLYLFFYYLGVSIGGTGAGLMWSQMGWSGVVLLVCTAVALALALAVVLARIPARQAEPVNHI